MTTETPSETEAQERGGLDAHVDALVMLSCPFCGGEGRIVSGEIGSKIYYSGNCLRCGANGQRWEEVHNAAKSWNKRCANIYAPKTGDCVYARRKVVHKRFTNHVVGPVVDVWDNACRVVTNQGTESEGDFRLYCSDWDFQFLHEA